MGILLLVVMAVLLIAALNRNDRRQPPYPPGPHGDHHPNDRDWARIQLDLSALGGECETKTYRHLPRLF